MLRVAFRADGGKNVGMGHIMRCLSLANAFRRDGHKVYFFSKADAGIEVIQNEKFDVVRLPSVAQNTEGFFYGSPAELTAEAAAVVSWLHSQQIDVLVVDTYNVTNEYFQLLKPHVKKLAYIDDINKFSYAVDIIVNGNITGKYLEYRQYDGQQLLLLGSTYNMIRDEFQNLPARNVRKQVAEIMITTGGADPYNLTNKLLAILLHNQQLKTLRMNVLVGSGFTNVEHLINMSRNHDNVVLYANSVMSASSPAITYSNISDIMLRSDLALSAGGSTLYEFAACGTPVLAFVLADNQEFIVQKMDELGYVQSMGWYNQLDDNQVVNALLNLMNNFEKRQEMSFKGQRLVDGRGTERIVKSIINSVQAN
ncbi:UDP-2,4-diacetamido-2,4,6-trideoxy-beta-L-altropyranose hydrolase [Sporomusa ovata DSM 2662]|uniref:N-Acetylneuraminate cytidylyltransferase n=1 Tax=Sporomusa ovata TaxID=2378 RepID=A0A0U1KSR8_9FIRM|nr:UDP-2,4-diacetamido-2,4,6-trideoxy-beta-L-altropyranose hydrolase [Sporomusa ovata]EQB26357.1 pseudaminic acid biosynthesis-associated protein PseG [Sporomusa ovata DSM 2662]CQR70437.1 N-Acetylneuraminate cytidylyltransferase [Sporomusa ovata]